MQKLSEAAGQRAIPRAEEIAYSLYPKYFTRTDIVIEVGANRGGGTLLLSDLSSFVYSFEPNPFVFEKLKSNLGGRPNVEIYNLGAGANTEKAVFNLPPPDASTLGSRFEVEGGRYIGKIAVDIARLDTLRFPYAPTCMVLDCEGSEIGALDGAAGLLASPSMRTLLMEAHQLSQGFNTASAITAIVESEGFKTEKTLAPDGSLWVIARR